MKLVDNKKSSWILLLLVLLFAIKMSWTLETPSLCQEIKCVRVHVAWSRYLVHVHYLYVTNLCWLRIFAICITVCLHVHVRVHVYVDWRIVISTTCITVSYCFSVCRISTGLQPKRWSTERSASSVRTARNRSTRSTAARVTLSRSTLEGRTLVRAEKNSVIWKTCDHTRKILATNALI